MKKHILQMKFIGITFVCMLFGVTSLAVSQAIIFGKIAGMTVEETEEAAEKYSFYFNILFCVVVIVVFLILSRRIIRRIEVMNRNVEQIAKGNIEMLTDVKGNDELVSLSQNINEMARTLQDSIEKEREMVCTVAHDLRTPVTSIQGYAQLLEKSSELSEENKAYASIIEQKSVALSEQINELLEYSVLQFEEKEYTFEPLSMSQLLEQVVVEFIPQLEKESMSFTLNGNKSEFRMNCNQNLMIRLFENLMNNCIRYGKEGKQIEIQMVEEENQYRIAFSNYASVLTSEELEHLFDAFYQGREAKNYRTESKGLGLAIVKKIVMIHKGTIHVENEESAGKITFQMEFLKPVES